MNYVIINNKKYELKDVPQDTPILWVLRDYLNMTGTKFGCGVAQCGACTVLLENKAIRSCSTPISEAYEKNITTIENKEDKELKALRIVWREHDVAQPHAGQETRGNIFFIHKAGFPFHVHSGSLAIASSTSFQLSRETSSPPSSRPRARAASAMSSRRFGSQAILEA